MTAAATTTQPARTARQQLQRFCAAGFELREWMRQPFQVGTWAYATNGHWIARMHAPGLGKLPAHTAKHPQQIGAMFMDAPFHLLQPMPHFDCPPCAACGGSGLARWVTCTHCRGKGYTGKRQACECLHCYGAGKVAQAATVETPQRTPAGTAAAPALIRPEALLQMTGTHNTRAPGSRAPTSPPSAACPASSSPQHPTAN